MKTQRFTGAVFVLAAVWSALACSAAQLPDYRIRMNLGYFTTPEGIRQKVQISWPSSLTNAQGERFTPEFTVERSTDLRNWRRVVGALRAVPGRSAASFSFLFDHSPAPIFYRVKADPATELLPLGSGGGEVFGYTATVQEVLDDLGWMDVASFEDSYPQPAYLPSIGFDPTRAKYWTNFTRRHIYDFTLNAGELARFRTNGFVVSERLGSRSFGDVYYKLWTDDMPVFVTTDSILQAWHRSSENLLAELEEFEFSPGLERILRDCEFRIADVSWMLEDGPLRDRVDDASYYVSVAASLLTGREPSQSTSLGRRVAATLATIKTYATTNFPLFGTERHIDFSQFIPRGHYTKTPGLERYFQAMMWLGQIDLRLLTFPPNREDDLRQLATAIVMFHANYVWLEPNWGWHELTEWSAFETMLSGIFGPADSMTFGQMRQVLEQFKLRSFMELINFRDPMVLTNMQTSLQSGELGAQLILGYPQHSPLSPAQLRMPRSFTILGQRFALDSWAMGQVVFDRVLWPVDEPGKVLYGKVLRRKPSCLDVAFAVLGNDSAVPEIAARIRNEGGVDFRDGKPYQHNLYAVRSVIDSQNSVAWTNTVYESWLAALRTLSTPASSLAGAVPEAMRTRAWAMKDLNTQMAGWTQLRHDTLLYAKQSYTAPFLCDYPDGFVEPRPEFFGRMRALAELMKRRTAKPWATGTVEIPDPDAKVYNPQWKTVSIEQAYTNRQVFLSFFAQTMAQLETMARKELAQQPFSASETLFLRNLAENTTNYVGERQYTGWYPALFYKNSFAGIDFHKDAGCDYPDGLVVDVHTDLPDQIVGDPGAIIHEGVGNVDLLVIAVDNGPDRAVYAGPVLSHYEFEKPMGTRMTDEQWKAALGSPPPRPPWTGTYLVPK